MLRELFYLFLPYRSYLAPFLFVSCIVAPCWLLLRLYRHRASARRWSFSRELVLLIFVLYLAGLAVATLSLNHNSRSVAEAMAGVELRPNLATLTCSSAILSTDSRAQGFCMHNLRGNVMLFFPLGILIPLVLKRVRFWRGIQIAIALSVSIELFQYLSRMWGSYRAADVNDVILNVFGAALGLLLMSLLRMRRPARPEIARA